MDYDEEYEDYELYDLEHCLREQQLDIKLKGARESLLEATLAASVSDALAALMKSRQSPASGCTVQEVQEAAPKPSESSDDDEANRDAETHNSSVAYSELLSGRCRPSKSDPAQRRPGSQVGRRNLGALLEQQGSQRQQQDQCKQQEQHHQRHQHWVRLMHLLLQPQLTQG